MTPPKPTPGVRPFDDLKFDSQLRVPLLGHAPFDCSNVGFVLPLGDKGLLPRRFGGFPQSQELVVVIASAG